MRGCGSVTRYVGGTWMRRGEAGPVPIMFPSGISEVMTSKSQAGWILGQENRVRLRASDYSIGPEEGQEPG